MRRIRPEILLLALCLGGCAESQFIAQAGKIWGRDDATNTAPDYLARNADGQPIPYKVGKPYTIMGRTYAPKEDWSYAETGTASWYGDEFHGRPTANGEPFDKNALTAAHKTLPLPSLVRVTNLENGRSAILRVNDRGPFSRGRIIDVSHQAARVLGFEAEGTARVKVELLTEESQQLAMKHGAKLDNELAETRRRQDPLVQQATANSPPKAPMIETLPLEAVEVSPPAFTSPPAPVPQAIAEQNPLANGYYVQLGAFGRAENVERLQNQLKNLGQIQVSPLQTNGGVLYRVRLGPLIDQAQAHAVQRQVQSYGLPDAKIVFE